MIGVGWIAELHPAYWLGLATIVVVMVWEHRIVRADDLSRVGAAFFNMNAVVSVVYFATVLASVALGKASA
jgi:4-hydroxybenzoate polyprenyltransferase